jgi:hypothetical protein
MKLAKIISVLGLLVMTAGILYALIVGDFAVDGAAILANPWGIVSLVDLYTGFILFSMWIVYREKAFLPSLIWIVLMMTLGFWTGALYTAVALFTSGGDWRKFWMGKRT